MADVYASAAGLLGQPGKPVKREVTVGLEVAQRRNSDDTENVSARAMLPSLAEMLKSEIEDPPEHFRDPIMLTIMSDPVVLSSGHVFDRSTVYETTGGGPPRFRFQSCPMSRARIDAKAYPLVYLKSQIIEYKLKRLDGILGAVKAHVPCGDETARTALSELLDVASELLIGGGGLGIVKYSHRAASYYGLRREVVSSDKWPPLLKELGGVIAKDGGAAADLVRAFAALDDALREAVQSLWALLSVALE